MKKLFLMLLSLLLIICFIPTRADAAYNSGNTVKPLANPLLPSLAPMIKKVSPGVVNIQAEGKIDVPTLALRRGEGGKPTITPGAPVKRNFEKLGSGVVMDPSQGYIVTNAHVVQDAKKITVHFSDGSATPAKLIGTDELSDIAVLQVSGMKLTALSITNIDKVEVGDFVIAIGSPFGLNQTVTFGIISALQRNDLRIEGFENFIQTDAAINSGNSGGALINMRGELVGINTAILSATGGNIGIGFAIPVDMVNSIMQQLIKYGEVRRGVLGLFGQPFTPELAKAMDIKPTDGVVVTAVNAASPAEQAGVKIGDIITSVNGKKIKNPFQLRNALGVLRVGSAIELDIIRQGKVMRLSTRLTAAKDQEEAAQRNNPFLNGVRLALINQTTRGSRSSDTIQVTDVEPETPAWLAGLRPGDIIVSANMTEIHNIEDLMRVSKQHRDRLLLNIMRGEGAMFIIIK